MKKKSHKIIVFNGMKFASPGHLMNHFRMNDIHHDISTKYLTQCAYKNIENVKGASLKYLYETDETTYLRIKSLTRSGKGFDGLSITPYDFFNNNIMPHVTTQIKIDTLVSHAIENGIGTQKDFDDMIKKAKIKK